jgi:hypothetical protein
MQDPSEGGNAASREDVWRRFKAATHRLSPKEAEDRTREVLADHPDPEVRGKKISWLSIQNYRKGTARPTEATIRKMEAFLAPHRPSTAAPGWTDGYQAAVEEIDAFIAQMKVTAPKGAAGVLDAASSAEGRATPEREVGGDT